MKRLPGDPVAESRDNCWRESKEEATVSGMPVHKGGQAGRATEGSRESGLTPRAHLLQQRVCGDAGPARHGKIAQKNIAVEDGAVAGGGRQGTAVDRDEQFSVRGHRGRIIARGS